MARKPAKAARATSRTQNRAKTSVRNATSNKPKATLSANTLRTAAKAGSLNSGDRSYNAMPHNRGGKPRLLVNTPRLTAKQLMTSVWAGDKERSKDIAVKTIKRVGAPNKMSEYVVYRVRTYNKVKKHTYYITLMFRNAVSADSKMIIDDDTYRHCFMYEYALAKRGNAFIYRSNGDAPTTTNPRLKAGISKHAFMAIKTVLSLLRGRTLNVKP